MVFKFPLIQHMNLKHKNKTLLVLMVLILLVTILVSYHVMTKQNACFNAQMRRHLSEVNVVKPKRSRIFCMILTQTENFKTKAKQVHRTWARDCDKYFFIAKMNAEAKVTNEYTDPFPIMHPAGHEVEAYEKLTDKIYTMMRAVYQRYNNYDWYLKADDDSFIFMDNLRDFLETKDPSELLTYGYDFKVRVEHGYQSGGAGYILGKEAFNRIGKALNQNYSFCPNEGIEDIDVGKCLRKLGVRISPSLDEKNRERFHPLSFQEHFNGDFKAWIFDHTKNGVKKGIDCCSEQSISFHYMSPVQIEKLYALWLKLKCKTKKPYNVIPILLELLNSSKRSVLSDIKLMSTSFLIYSYLQK